MVERPGTRAWNVAAAIVASIVLAVPTRGDARPPEIRNLNLRGLQIGAATVLTIDGGDLLPNPKVFLGDRSVESTVDPQSTPTRLILSVPLPDSMLPGIVQFRLATADGVSNSQFVGIDRFPQLPIADTIASRPAVLHGTVPGSGVSRTSFSGKAGEDVIVEVEARRLGSKLRPVIHIYDSRRVQVGWASPSNTLAGDTRLALKLPRDDQYSVEIHDAQYAPPGPGYFRLKIGQWQFADMAFPPAVPKGQNVTVDLIGNVAGVRVPVRLADESAVAVPWPAAAGLAPSVLGSSLTEVIEGADDQPTPLPAVPVAVSGRLTAAGQRDRFTLPVQPGTKLLLEVFAERIGSQIDAVLEVRSDKNVLLATNDDGPGTVDPRLEFTVPADQASLEIIVRDNLDRGGDATVYRVVITRADAPLPQFDVVLKADAVNVAAGEIQVLEAFVTRQAYDGPVQFQAPRLPPGVTLQGTEIPAGANGTLLTVTYAGDASASQVIRFRAQSPDGAIACPVRIETTPDDRLPHWMRESVAIAATPRAASPFLVSVGNEAAMTDLVLASKPAVAVKLVRPAGTYGPIRLSLVTSQPTPRVNGQPNLNQTLRGEKPVEVPVDAAVKGAGDALAAIDKQHADSVKQAQAAQGDAKPAADAKVAELAQKKTVAETALRAAEAAAVYQIDYSIIVPSTLVESSCDIAIRAELLNPERNIVLRTAYSPVRRLPVLNPLSIALAATTVEAIVDPKAGATVKLAGRLQRHANYKGDVTVSVVGLPAGVSAANVSIKGDQAEFAIDVKVPASFAAAEISGIKLTATGPPDPLSGNVPVKSAETAAQIRITRTP